MSSHLPKETYHINAFWITLSLGGILIIVTRLYKILDGLSTTLHCLYIVHKDVNFKFEKTICKVFTKDCKR